MILVLLLLFAVIASTVFLALLMTDDFLPRLWERTSPQVQIGDAIVYRKQKVSTHPSPRAYDIHPAGQGDTYSYFVDKFWIVENVFLDGRILVTTRTHKQHYLQPDDPNLQKAGLIARLRYRNRFPQLAEAA